MLRRVDLTHPATCIGLLSTVMVRPGRPAIWVVACFALVGCLPSYHARLVPGIELDARAPRLPGATVQAHGRRLSQSSGSTVVMPVYNATNYGDMLLVSRLILAPSVLDQFRRHEAEPVGAD